MSSLHCPQCGAPRRPDSNDRCRHCGWRPPATAAFEPPAADDQDFAAWNRFRELISVDSADQLLIDILQSEQRASEFRDRVIAEFESAAPPTRAEVLASHAEHIDTFIQPLFAEANARIANVTSPKATQIREYLVARQRIWQLLSEALRLDDERLLQAHQQAWNGVPNVDLVKTAVEKARYGSADPAAQTGAFLEALSVFTPRVLVTPALVAINLAILVAGLAMSGNVLEPKTELLLDWGANFGPATLNGQWWRLFTCMFLHGSILHVLMNVWVLNDFGRVVERLTGNVGFLVVYVISGLAGSLASLAWNPQVLSVGASGAVFGIGGVLLGWVVMRRDTIPATVLSHLRNSVGMFIAYNVLNMFRGGNIDHAAHAGGLVAGIACGLLISQPLGPQVRASRWWKSLLTGGVGAAALCGAVFFLPPAPPAPLNVRAEFQAFTAAEQKAMTTFQTLAKANDDGQLTNVEFADRIEQEVLPAWAAARMRLEKLRAEPMAKQNVVAKVAQYAGEREQAWRLFAAAARENDEEKLRQATNQWRAADATARSIGQ